MILPYGVAFKLVAISGLVLFPIACWTFGRLAAFRHPIPELFAIAGLCFLLDESYQIYGGNVKSTMAGEFSFSIALTLAMFGLGLLAAGLRTGKYRVSAAIVLSFAAVSHGIVLIFVAVSAIILCLVWIDRKRFVYAITTGATTLLLSAWWVGPFLFGHEYMTDMKYGFRPEGASDSFFDMFFPLTDAARHHHHDAGDRRLHRDDHAPQSHRHRARADRHRVRRVGVPDARQPVRSSVCCGIPGCSRSSTSCGTC